jgi:signal transduction histidine kinase
MMLVIGWISTSGSVPEVLSLSGVAPIRWEPGVTAPDGLYVELRECVRPAELLDGLPALPLFVDAVGVQLALDLPPGACLVTDEAWREPAVASWLAGLETRRQLRVLLRHDIWTPVAVLSGHLEMLTEGMYGPLTPRLEKATGAMKRALGQLESTVDNVGVRLFGSRHGGTADEQE